MAGHSPKRPEPENDPGTGPQSPKDPQGPEITDEAADEPVDEAGEPTMVRPKQVHPDLPDATEAAELVKEPPIPEAVTVIMPLRAVAGEIRGGKPVDKHGQSVDAAGIPTGTTDAAVSAAASAAASAADFPDELTNPALAVPALRGPAAVIRESAASAAAVLRGTIFPPTKRREVLATYDLQEATKAPSKPTTTRQVSYLIIDSDTAADRRSAFLTIKSELALIKDARDFQISLDDNGNIIIIALAERGAIQKLLAIASSIAQERPQARMALKGGTLTHHENYFGIEDYPDTTTEATWRTTAIVEGGTSIFIDRSLAVRIQDPGNRLGSSVEIKTAEFMSRPEASAEPSAASTDFLALSRFTNRIRPESGGPDRLIGYENELKALKVHTGIELPQTGEDETKLVVLKASAGMGKSRLISEILLHHPSYVLASVDAADKNVVGSSLVTVVNQLITALRDDPMLGLDNVTASRHRRRLIIDGDIVSTGDDPADTAPIALGEFASLAHADQVQFAAKHPQAVTELCQSAMAQLNFGKAQNTLLVLEDLHHTDRVSLPFLTQLVARYLKDTEGRAVISMRPEEMYKAAAVDDLERAVSREHVASSGPVKKISLPGLDFRQTRLAYDFAFHSLPPGVRHNRRLGPWYQTLAKIAGTSPWIMKSLMDAILETDREDRYQHILQTETLVDVRAEILDRLERIAPDSQSDIAIYFHERIESLDTPTRTVLQCIALMGGKVNSDQISKLTAISSHTAGDHIEVTRKLVVGGYLQKLDGDIYGLQHETTRAIVIGSLRDERAKVSLARDLYDKFRDDQQIHPDARHELLSVIANSRVFAPAAHETFWTDYASATDASLENARQHNDTGNIHRIALAVLGTPMLRTELSPGSPDTVRNLCITALFAQAESSRLLGKFDEVDQTVAALEVLHRANPESVDLDRAHVVKFLKAYMVPNAKAMREILERDLDNGSRLELAVRTMLEIKLAYRERRFDEAMRLFNDNKDALLAYSDNYQGRYKMPLPEFIEIWRIVAANCTLERARQSIIHPAPDRPEFVFDQDVVMQPLAVSTNMQKTELEIDLQDARRALDYIYALKSSFPLILDDYSEANITDQLANIAAFEGDHEKASRLFGETWRIAMQMGVYPSAARAAKLQGDIRIVQTLRENPPNRQKIIEAIGIYSEQGINLALSQMSPESVYQYLLRIQRIRAVGILLTTYNFGLTREGMGDFARLATVQEIRPYLETALADFKYLNESWPQTAQDREMCYDIMGYVNNILYVVQMINNPARPKEQHILLDPALYSARYPLMDIRAVAAGREFGDTSVTDAGFGEVARKRGGLEALVKALRAKNESGAAQARFTAGNC